MTGAMAAPLVEAKDLTRVFDVSKPWLNRVIEGERKAYLRAVTGDLIRHRPARDAGAGGRIGLRQVDGGAHGGRAAAADGRHASPSTASTCGRRCARPSARRCAGACR